MLFCCRSIWIIHVFWCMLAHIYVCRPPPPTIFLFIFPYSMLVMAIYGKICLSIYVQHYEYLTFVPTHSPFSLFFYSYCNNVNLITHLWVCLENGLGKCYPTLQSITFNLSHTFISSHFIPIFHSFPFPNPTLYSPLSKTHPKFFYTYIKSVPKFPAIYENLFWSPTKIVFVVAYRHTLSQHMYQALVPTGHH